MHTITDNTYCERRRTKAQDKRGKEVKKKKMLREICKFERSTFEHNGKEIHGRRNRIDEVPSHTITQHNPTHRAGKTYKTKVAK